MNIYYTKKGKFETKKSISFFRNILHREDGPAVIYPNNRKEWWLKGKLHRLDGPAVIWENGDKEWFVNGKLHRLDGPAYIMNNGYNIWYINDKELNEEEVEAWIRNNNINLKKKEHKILFMLKFG